MKLKNKIFFSVFSLSVFASSFLYADISGTVYKDFNLNGEKDIEDVGIVAAQVNAFCEDGSTPSTITNRNGQYTISVATGGNKCRIEVDASHLGMSAGSNGLGSATPLVDVVVDGQQHNVSVASSASYCQANPDVIMAAMPGKLDDNGNLLPNFDKQGSLYKIILPKDGEHNEDSTIDNKRTTLTQLSDTGAIWGLAYKKSTKDIFASASIKRYVPLKDDSTDTGKIYKVDSNNNVTLFTTVPNAGSVASNRDYEGTQDEDTKALTGRAGLGDLDISEDETKLYTVNMKTKSLIAIDSVSGDILSSVSIPNPYGAECSDDMVRPWALKVLGKNIFIGSVCENKIEDGVGASIQKYDGTSFSELARTNTLLYLRPKPYIGSSEVNPRYQYHNWEDGNSENFQPMLTDIEFSNKGDLILGYTGRAGNMRNVSMSDGDIRKMCLNQDGSYTDESTAAAPTDCASHSVQYNGDTDNTYYEFYRGDEFNGGDGDNNFDGHPETASGAMAQAPGRDNIVVGMVDATDWYQAGGLGLYSHTTGEKVGTQAVIKRDKVADGGEREYYGAKAGGLGDVELLCDPAPIEIGNYVWEDTDGDGIQDPEEPALSSVPVKLYDASGVLQGTATTDASGHYYFGGINNVNMGRNSLHTNSSYKLSIDIADANSNPPTQTDINNNSDDIRDNDSVLEGERAVISFNTSTGNNHSYDFGFSAKPTVSIGSLVWEDLNNNGRQDDNENGIADVNVTLLDENGRVMPNPVQKTEADGQYYFSGLDEGTYSILVSPPSGKGYIPCTQQTTVDNDDTENDSNIATANGNEYISGKFTLQVGTEPVENNGKTDTDSADDTNDENGNMTVDFCFYRPTSLGDRVWYDTNKNGIQDINETGVEGVTVELLSNCSRRGSTQITTTDAEGRYKFTNLNAGDYCVEFSNLPAGYVVTSKDSGEEESDSDVSTTAPFQTETTTLEAGENDLSWDMGIYTLKASLGDRVWYDTNKNGIQDINETGVEGITVELLTDCSRRGSTQTTTTDVDGRYKFTNLNAGDYCVEFSNLLDGYVVTNKDSGEEESDSDASLTAPFQTETTTLEEGENDLSWDMGIYKSITHNNSNVDYSRNNQTQRNNLEPNLDENNNSNIDSSIDRNSLDTQENRTLRVFDDNITVESIGSVTTINILENDHGDLDIESIKFVTSNEAEILYENGTAVGGTTLETTDKLVVEGEGVWTISRDGTIVFRAEDGFTGIPTPVYYVVKSKQGFVSNVGKVTISSGCDCDIYDENSVPVLTKMSMLLLVIFSSILGTILYREELQELK